VRQLREAKDWTQEHLAGEAGLDRSYVSGLEVGRRNPTYLILLKLARVLGLPISELVDLNRTR
jgi:transcriptional regulator with XRE-family HTH domain